jgi:hypothetical protein
LTYFIVDVFHVDELVKVVVNLNDVDDIVVVNVAIPN